MQRRMSVFLTREQVRDGSKLVTRRAPHTWTKAKPGDVVTLIEKGQGLAKGEKQVPIRDVEIVSNEVIPLVHGLNRQEVKLEGFPGMDPVEFAVWWANSHGFRRTPLLLVRCRRIEWRYVDWFRRGVHDRAHGTPLGAGPGVSTPFTGKWTNGWMAADADLGVEG